MSHTTLRKPVAWVLTILLLLSTMQGALAQRPDPYAEAPASAGIRPADMDLTVEPGADFFRFANGGWLDRNEVPPELPAFGVSEEVNDQTNRQLYRIMNSFEPDTVTEEGKARSLFDQVMDTDTRDAQGAMPLQPILNETAEITSVEEGMVFHEHADNYQLAGVFAVFPSPLPEDATTNGGVLYGPFLNLPSEDYYLDESEEGEEIREAWVDTTAELLVHLGYSEEEAVTAAEMVLAFETELVHIKTPDAELFSDPVSMNNPRTLDELDELVPGMDWHGFVQQTHLPDTVETFIVWDLPYFEAIQDVLDEADPQVLRYLFDIQLIWTYAPYLSTEIGEIAFSFQGPVLLGVTEQGSLEGEALGAVADWMPDTLARAYVERYFTAESRALVEEMIDDFIEAFRIRIEQNPWMTDETRAEALAKLDLMVVGVGYPDAWESYEGVEIGDSLFETVLSAYDVSNAQGLSAIDQPVDRTQWFMAPFEVNAGYDPSRNMMIYPAAILQPPFFDPEADIATNYGAMGSVIGHEMTHAFDLSGAQYDGNGNLVSWWSDEDLDAFLDLNDQVIEYYSAIEFQPGLMIDGQLTVGENVADMGGVQIGYDALLIALETHGPEHQPWFLTQQQRFFVSYATSWREVGRPEFYAYLVATDEHAPAPLRAVEPLRHMDAFHEAFDIRPGDAEYLPPEERIVIW